MIANEASDAELMAGIAAGDMAALGELVRRHQDKVLALAWRLLGRWDLAEEAGQETFLHVYRAAKRYRPEAKFATWLYRIVVNLCLDAKRRAKRDPVGLADPAAGLGQEDHPDLLMETQERADQVRRAVWQLPERQRIAVILHTYHGLSHREVAEATGWSRSAVESLLVRAYASLRKSLAGLKEN